jgi:hypothetical protein
LGHKRGKERNKSCSKAPKKQKKKREKDDDGDDALVAFLSIGAPVDNSKSQTPKWRTSIRKF